MSGSTPNTGPDRPSRHIEVVAALLRDRRGRILLTRRPEGKPLSGLWEFPGGKVEPGERPEEALARELFEELGIEVGGLLPLIAIRHPYPEGVVRLRLYEVEAFSGEPYGREGQEVAWFAPESLLKLPMPPADRPAVRALLLPKVGVVLEGEAPRELLKRLELLYQRGFRLFYLRARTLSLRDYREVALQARAWLEERPGAYLMVREPLPSHPRLVLHLDRRRLMGAEGRPEGFSWVSAACHDLEALKRAEKLGVDFALLSPIQKTPTHPEARPIGWRRAAKWLEEVNLPVYLLGGMALSDLERARAIWAQGIFGIGLGLQALPRGAP